MSKRFRDYTIRKKNYGNVEQLRIFYRTKNISATLYFKRNIQRIYSRTLIDELIKSLEYLYEHTGECRENIKAIDKQIADLCAKNLVVTKIYTNGILNAADFTRQTTEIGNRIKSLRSERKKFFEQNTDEANLEELKDLQETLRTYTPSSRFNEKLFEDIVQKIIVEDNATLQFHLIGGVILTEKIKVKSRCKKNEK